MPLRARRGWAEFPAPCADPRTVPFSNWARSCDAILWTHVPHVEQLVWVREQRKHAAVFGLWGEWYPGDSDILEMASSVLCPTRAATLFAERQKLPAAFVGFHAPLPPVSRGVEAPGARILFPMHARWLYQTEMTAIDVLSRALYRCPGATATVLYSASSLAGYARRRLQRFARRLGGRLRLQKATSRRTFTDALLSHDILFWPTHVENTCCLGLAAGMLGAVPVTFPVAPVSEIFTEANAALMPCRVGATVMGIPVAEPDYPAAEAVLRHTVEDRVGLLRRRREGLRIAMDRRILFEDAMKRIFE